MEKETLEEGGRKKRKAQDGGRNSDQLFPPRGLVEYAWNNRISHAISRGKSFSFVSFSTCSRLFSLQLVPPPPPVPILLALLLVSFVSPYPRGAEGNLTLISEHLQFSRTVAAVCKLNRANSHFSIDKLFSFSSTLIFPSPVFFLPRVHVFLDIFLSPPSLYIIKEFRSRQLFPLTRRALMIFPSGPKWNPPPLRRLENDVYRRL